MVAEWENLLSRCLNPLFTVKLIVFYFTKLVAIVRRRLLPETAHYPQPVRQAAKACMIRKAGACGAIATTPRRPEKGTDSLRLATGYCEFSGSPAWESVFNDPEQTASLHRWNWLLTKLAEKRGADVEQWGLRLMRDWNERMMKHREGIPWTCYTTGERICNAILFLALADRSVSALQELPDDMTHALAAMAEHVARHLEYKGSESTGNHVVNNARALCFAGQALQFPSATGLAAAILRNDLPRLVGADGFLREGSSHYHFLFTRWLLEMLWVCRITREYELPARVEPFAALMVQRCWFFLVAQPLAGRWVMPLIGDVSPDCSWEWLIDLPWSGEAMRLYAPPILPRPIPKRGWASLFDGGGIPTDVTGIQGRRGFEEAPTFQPFPESGWYRLDWGAVSLFWHVEPRGAPGFPSHGHCDIGSFNLYWNGVEIVADPGRLNYREDDSLGIHGVSAGAHNSVRVDGYEPFVYWHRGRYPKFYRTGEVQVSWDVQPGRFALCLRHDGFSRLQGDAILFEREFRVSREGLTIEDRLSGRSRRTIATYFQWAPGVSVLQTEDRHAFRIEAGSADFHGRFSDGSASHESTASGGQWQTSAGGTSEASGWYFPGYGEKIAACTLLLERQAHLPDAWRYSLQWDGSDT